MGGRAASLALRKGFGRVAPGTRRGNGQSPSNSNSNSNSILTEGGGAV